MEEAFCSAYGTPFRETFVRTFEHNLKVMRAADDEILQGQKGSRLAKWILSADTKRAQAGAEKPETIEILGSQSSVGLIYQINRRHLLTCLFGSMELCRVKNF